MSQGLCVILVIYSIVGLMPFGILLEEIFDDNYDPLKTYGHLLLTLMFVPHFTVFGIGYGIVKLLKSGSPRDLLKFKIKLEKK